MQDEYAKFKRMRADLALMQSAKINGLELYIYVSKFSPLVRDLMGYFILRKTVR